MSLKREGQRGFILIVEVNHGRRPGVTLRKGQQREEVGVGRDLRNRIGPNPKWIRLWGLGEYWCFTTELFMC